MPFDCSVNHLYLLIKLHPFQKTSILNKYCHLYDTVTATQQIRNQHPCPPPSMKFPFRSPWVDQTAESLSNLFFSFRYPISCSYALNQAIKSDPVESQAPYFQILIKAEPQLSLSFSPSLSAHTSFLTEDATINRLGIYGTISEPKVPRTLSTGYRSRCVASS